MDRYTRMAEEAGPCWRPQLQKVCATQDVLSAGALVIGCRFAGSKRVSDPQQIRHCVKEALVKVIQARNKELDKFQDPTYEEPTIDKIKYLEGSWQAGWRVSEQESNWNFDLSDVDFRFAVSHTFCLSLALLTYQIRLSKSSPLSPASPLPTLPLCG